METVQSIPVQLCGIDIASALRIATNAGIYAYDAYFLECALRLRCPLLTLDRRMKTVGKELGNQIIELNL